MPAWRIYFWANYPGRPYMPPIAGHVSVLLNSTSPYMEVESEEEAWKHVEAAIGKYPLPHLYNIEGWKRLIASGESFRIIHPRPDGVLWMLGVLYSAEGFPQPKI